MAWLKLTDTSDRTIYVNMANVVEIIPYSESDTSLRTVAPGVIAGHGLGLNVKESPEAIVSLLTSAGEKVVSSSNPEPMIA